MSDFIKTLAAALAVALSPAAAQAQSVRPLIYLETSPEGSRYVRVMERAVAPFAARREISDRPASPRINVTNPVATLVRNVSVRSAKYGVHVRSPSPVSIENLSFSDWDGGGSIHGGAIKIDRSAGAPTYIQRVFADAMEIADASYRRSNTDFIGVERNSGPVFVRYATGRNFGDGGVDAKSDVALMNVTIDGAHRGLRIWSGVTLTIVNGIVNVPEGHQQVWLQQSGARLRYYNTLWCIGVADPSPHNPACSDRPSAIGVDGISQQQARRQIVALTSNPLSAIPFFATRIDRVVVEYSDDRGRSWRLLADDGSAGHPPRGDLRYRIPFSLSRANYLFRAHFEHRGRRVGAAAIIDENGRQPDQPASM